MIAFAIRVLRVFLRDKATIFFTYFSALILLVLYGAFFGKMNVDSLLDNAPGVSRSAATGFVTAWVVAALITVTSINAPMAGMSRVANDKLTGQMADFLVAPLAARQLMGGYLLATWLYTLCATAVIGVIGLIGVVVFGGTLPSVLGLAQLVVLLIVGSAVFSAAYLLVAMFISSQGALSAASGLVGALSGFLALAYVPAGMLGESVVSVANLLPFAPAAVVARQSVAAQSLDAIGMPQAARDDLASFLGMDFAIFGGSHATWLAWIIMLLYGLVAFVAAVVMAGRLRRYVPKG